MTSSHSHYNGEMIQPFVHYHCSCLDVHKSVADSFTTEASNSSLINPPSVNFSRIHFSTFSLSKFYFCEDCHQIRCPRCVQEEIVCYYCPNCLFEVPTASVKSERNRCARNCFQCPICQNTLSVVPSNEPPAVTSPISAAPQPQPQTQTSGAPFYLLCGVCRWDSQEIEMTFEKATGLALQLQKTEDERPDVKEFDHLKEHFEKHLRMNAPSTTLPTQLLTIPGMSSFSNRYGSSGLAHAQQKSDDVNPYEAVVKVEEENKLVDDLLRLTDVNQITTLAQRMNQLSDQPYKVDMLQPQRIHLRTKRVKRCRSCRHILIKPEQKAQATKFKIKLVALNYIPKITIAKLTPNLSINETTQVIFKFSNPLLDDVTVNLFTDEEVEDYGKIKLLTTHFTIAPYNELLEYDDEEFSTEKLTSKTRTPSQAQSIPKPDPGVYEKKGNYTSIILEVTPLKEVEEFKFPLRVTHISRVIDIDNENSESQTAGSATEGAEEAETPEIDAQKPGGTKESGVSSKSLSFWTVIGLGPVLREPASPVGSVRVVGTTTTSQTIATSSDKVTEKSSSASSTKTTTSTSSKIVTSTARSLKKTTSNVKH